MATGALALVFVLLGIAITIAILLAILSEDDPDGPMGWDSAERVARNDTAGHDCSASSHGDNDDDAVRRS